MLFLLSGCNIQSASKYEIESLDFEQIIDTWEIILPGTNIESQLITNPMLGSIYLMTDSTLMSIDVESGKTLWKRDIKSANSAADLIHLQANFLIATDRSGREVYAFEAETGKLLWEYDAGIRQEAVRILSDSHNIYLAQSGFNDISIVALDLSGGDIVWEVTNAVFQQDSIRGFLLDSGVLYLESLKLWAIDSSSGDVLGVYPLDYARGEINYIEKDIFYRSNSYHQSVSAFRLRFQGSSEIWTYNSSCNDGGSHIMSPQNTSELDGIFVASPCHYLKQLDKNSGATIWSLKTVGAPKSIDLDEHDLLYATSNAKLAQVNITQQAVLGVINFKPSRRHYEGRTSVVNLDKWIIVTYGNNQVFGFKRP